MRAKLSNSAELIFRPDHEQLRLFDYSAHERALPISSLPPLFGGYQVGMDWSSHNFFRGMQRSGNLAVGKSIADDHEVDIALRSLGAFRERAIDECSLYIGSIRRERLL